MNFETIKCLSQLKNGSFNNSKHIFIQANRLTKPILHILYKEGLLLSIKNISNSFINNSTKLKIGLRYSCNYNMLNELKIISTPSKTVYLNYKDIVRLKLKKRIGVLSTTNGLKTLEDCRKEKLGGVFLFIC